ncbi:LysR family transcriptional regulator [Pseudonocardia sp. GCM10023141]|uniref:LysR family transcriptional regulator n=1 Tax=Pseudonocardia sp. GCM10023141 TaxID=3252653 RepID=UPI00361145FF
MEIRHLRSFVVVAQERNFTRAAAQLHVATSPLSRRIRELERTLGAELFVRAHHRIDLTPAGEALLPAARDVLARFDALPSTVAAVPLTARIGIAPDVVPGVRDALFGALAGRVSVRMHPASTATLLRLLGSGALDLALVHGSVRGAHLRHRLLRTDPVGVVVATGTGFDGREAVRLDELAHLPFATIDWSAAPWIYRGIDAVMTAAGVTGRLVVEGDNFAGLAQLVASGEAFTVAAAAGGAMAKAFAGEHVVHLRVEGADLTLSTVAAWRGDRTGDGGVVDQLVAALDQL